MLLWEHLTLLEAGGGIKCPDRRKSEKSKRKCGPIILNLVYFSSFGLLVHMQTIFFVYVSRFGHGGHFVTEIMIFSDRKKSVFQLCWKNTSSHKKMYETKKFYLIELHMERSNFPPQTKAWNATAKNLIFWKIPNISKFVKIWILPFLEELLPRVEKWPMKAIFPFILEVIHGFLDSCCWISTWTMYIDIRGPHIDLGTLCPPRLRAWTSIGCH